MSPVAVEGRVLKGCFAVADACACLPLLLAPPLPSCPVFHPPLTQPPTRLHITSTPPPMQLTPPLSHTDITPVMFCASLVPGAWTKGYGSKLEALRRSRAPSEE